MHQVNQTYGHQLFTLIPLMVLVVIGCMAVEGAGRGRGGGLGGAREEAEERRWGVASGATATAHDLRVGSGAVAGAVAGMRGTMSC